MSPEAVLQVAATGVVTVLSILGSVVWLDRKIGANGRELKGDMTSQTTDLKADITAVGDKSETAHRQTNEKLETLTVNVATLAEGTKCVEDKVDGIQRRLDEK